MKEFLNQWALIIGALGLIGIEISPIKINPIKWILKTIGNLLNSELKQEINTISKKVDKIEESQDFADVFNIKQRITNYHALLLGQNGLDENQYRRCFELETKYRFYKKKYPGRVNGHMDAMFAALHKNYENGNIILMEEDNNERTEK